MTVSLHRQLMIRLTVPLFALLVLDGIASYWLALHFSQRAYDAGLYDSARSLAQQVKFDSGRASIELPREALEMFEWDVLDRTYFAINSARYGLVLGHKDFPPPSRLPTRDLEPFYYDTVFGGEPVRAVAIRLPTRRDARQAPKPDRGDSHCDAGAAAAACARCRVHLAHGHTRRSCAAQRGGRAHRKAQPGRSPAAG
jgi:hypothetical protein